MPEVRINAQLLEKFEKGLNPRFPERSQIPARVLDYGEISTVLEIGVESEKNLAYKRLPMFRSEEEARSYQTLYDEYVKVLQNRIGLRVVPGDTIRMAGRGRFVVYIVQEKLPREAIGHRVIHRLSPAEVKRLVLAVLRETGKVFDFNRQHQGELEIGFDGQISNWVIVGFDPAAPRLSEEIELMYFDTSTPLLRKNGEEQLDPELFLRSAPSFLVWIIRLLFLQDVMTRYYDFRRVVVDLVANFYKEQRPDLIPGVVDAVNEFCATGMQASGFKPITMEEVRAYYREDAWIWRTYLTFRKIDRSLHRLLGREYPYVLPEKIQR